MNTDTRPIDWERFRQIVATHKTFLLMSHVRPDCDALGSELGMAAILDQLGKRTLIVNADPLPENLRFIDPQQRVRSLDDGVTTATLQEIDCMMVLDTSAWSQLGAMADVLRESRAQKVVVDHHVSEDDLGADSFKNVHAEATGVLVTEAAEHLGIQLNEEIAMPLFAAVATDTGWFRFASVGAETYRTVAKLVAAGASPTKIYAALYEQDTLARVRLRGTILARAECEQEGRLGHAYVLQEDFVRLGALPSDTEEVINRVLAIAGVEVAAMFVEQPGQKVKISFRSQGEFDCSRFAEEFGGGGHRAAAGVTISGSFDPIHSQVLDRLREAMRYS